MLKVVSVFSNVIASLIISHVLKSQKDIYQHTDAEKIAHNPHKLAVKLFALPKCILPYTGGRLDLLFLKTEV